MGNRKDKEGEQVEKKLLRKLKAKKKVTKKISISSLSTHRHAALLGSLLTVVIAYLFFRGYTDKRRPYIYPTEPIIVQYADEVPEETAIRVLGVYPHDKEAFTQGLFFERGSFFESTGGWGGSSSIRQVDLSTGTVKKQHNLTEKVFGEGSTILNNKLYMLSWQSGICFVMDPDELEVHTVFKYKGYGWGLAHNNTHLIMSDGSDTLTFRDPTSFEIVRSIKVTEKVAEGYSARYTRVPVKNLNELEYIPLTGLVYANVWFKDSIAAIDPATGYVVQWISVIAEETKEDLAHPHREACANGLAFDRETQKLYITGKMWSSLYHIELPVARLAKEESK